MDWPTASTILLHHLYNKIQRLRLNWLNWLTKDCNDHIENNPIMKLIKKIVIKTSDYEMVNNVT